MNTDGIVPEILNSLPKSLINVNYGNGKDVHLGVQLTPSEVQEEPKVKWEAAADKFYTLLMIDPDAPSRSWPFLGQVMHWMVANVKDCDLTTGELFAAYGGAGPPIGTGFHRYIFLVFEHSEKIDYTEKHSAKGSRKNRMRFSLQKFMEKYKFESAFAWNYFNAKWNHEGNCVVL